MTVFEKFYYDPSHYAGYSATENLLRVVKPDFARDKVVSWLESQDAYTLHRPIRRKFPRLHYNVANIDDLWEADLIELVSLRSYNDGYRYLLTIIDVLSKFVWVEPIRDKSGASVAEGFRRIVTNTEGRIPVYLQTDKGKEFVGQPLQNLLKEMNVRFRTARSPDVKAAVIERFNRTLKERLWRYFTHKNTRRYIDVLQDIVRAYNHTVHSTIQMQPACVTLENARVARENMLRRYRRLDVLQRRNRKRAPKYREGEQVRVSRAKGTFEKGYEANWSEEIFLIHRVLEWRNPTVYELKDLSGEIIDGIFYEQELARVSKNVQQEEFIIDKVIRSRGRGERKELFVSWRGYPSKFNSWIPASNLKTLSNHNEGGTVSDNFTEQQ